MLDIPHRKVPHIIPTPKAVFDKSPLIVLLRSAERGEVGIRMKPSQGVHHGHTEAFWKCVHGIL